jgi:hypothetical protein
MAGGSIFVGIGGWTFQPWRGVFYPEGLAQKRELEYASRQLTSIEINGTYYSIFKRQSWAGWREATPDGFVFSVKGSRFCTNRKQLGGAGESVARFIGQGLSELGDRLGPICWQFMETKKLDPEDMREVVRAYQDACAGVITRFEGFVAKFMGDGVLAYFGYPRAHEDEAERAVRAGLALIEAVGRLGEANAEPNVDRAAPSHRWVALRSTQPTVRGAPLAARVGIATGLVVVGDLVGEGAAQE